MIGLYLICFFKDHNASNISLQWDHAVDVFEYFKPKTLPEFDGYRSETISAEVKYSAPFVHL
jgi:calcineurin-binding protein cabin-1